MSNVFQLEGWLERWGGGGRYLFVFFGYKSCIRMSYKRVNFEVATTKIKSSLKNIFKLTTSRCCGGGGVSVKGSNPYGSYQG